MNSIFQVFGDSSPKRSVSDLSSSMVQNNIKRFNEPAKKLKGLSMRSNSDLNVRSTSPRSCPSKANLKDFGKSLLKTEFNKGHSTPSKAKVIKKQGLIPVFKELSPKILSPVSRNVNNDATFKRPKTPEPRQKASMFPQCETIAPYYDEEQEFYKNCVENLELEFLSLKMKVRSPSISNEDEGFMSDSDCEQLETSRTDNHFFMTYSDDESVTSCDSYVELPDLSDLDDIMN